MTEKGGGWTWLSMLGGQVVEEIGLVENRQSSAKVNPGRGTSMRWAVSE